MAAGVCWLFLASAAAAEDKRPISASFDAGTRLIVAGEELARAAGDARIGQARMSPDLAFLFDELESLATRSGDRIESATCGQPPYSLERLVTPECLAALLVSERRESRLTTEIVAQAFLEARQELLPRPRLPEFDGADATPEDPTRLTEWWKRFGLTGLEAIARIGRENIQHRETAESEQHTIRILRALRQVLREAAVIHLVRVIRDSPADHWLNAFAAPFQILNDPDAMPGDRLRAAEIVAALYDARLATEMHEVVRNLTGEKCFELVPEDLGKSLEPTRNECNATVERIKRIIAGGMPGEIVQALTTALDERAVTLRLLLAKLSRIENAETCGGAMDAMQRNVAPVKGDLGTRRMTRLAKQIAHLVKLCQPEITAAFEQRASEWLPDLCRGTQDNWTSTAWVPNANLPKEVGEAWSFLRDAMSPQDRVVICESPAENVFSRLSAAEESEGLSTGAKQALSRLQGAAIAHFRSQDFSALRSVLDTVRVPHETDGTVRHVEILRTLCRLSSADGDDGTEAHVVSALFADLGLAGRASLDAMRGSLCQILLGPAKVTTLGDLLDEMVSQTTNDEGGAEGVRSKSRERLAEVVKMIDAQPHEIARRVSAVGRAVRFARGAEVLVPLGPEGSGCTNNTQRRGLGAGLKIGAFEPRLDLSEPTRWTATLKGRATLVLCGANGSQGFRRVFSIHDQSSELTLVLTLDGETMRSAGDGVPEQWSTEMTEKTNQAIRNIAIDGDTLRPEHVENLPELLQAAGVDLAAITIVESALTGQSSGLDVRYGVDTGILLAVAIPLKAEESLAGPRRVLFCVAIPLTASPSTPDSGCNSASEVRAAADRMVQAVFSLYFERFVRRIGSDLNLAKPHIDDLVLRTFQPSAGSEGGSFLKDYIGVGLSAGENGKPTYELRLRIPAAIVLQELERAGLAAAGFKVPPLVGDLKISLRPDSSGKLQLGETSMPSLNPRYLFARILPEGGLDTGFLSVSPVISSDSKGPCSTKPKLRLALGPKAPLAGTLGFVCFVRVGGKLSARFVPDKEGSLFSRDGSWVFSYRNSEHGGSVEDPTITLKMKVTSDDPRFGGFSEVWATVRFNLATGSWELPVDGDHNREIYGRIERGANDLLPPGFRVRNLRIGSKGVEVSFDRAVAAGRIGQMVWHALSEGKVEAPAADAKRSCDLEKIFWLSRLVYEGKVPETLSASACKEDLPGLKDRAEPIQGLPVEWTCTAESEEPRTQVDECTIKFPKELSFCSDPVRLLVEWGAQDPILKADRAGECLKSRVDNLLPDKLARSVNLEDPEFKLVGECSNDPGDVQSCGIATDIQVDLSPLIADVEETLNDLSKQIGAGSESCTFGDERKLSLRGVMTFEGEVRLESGGAALLEGAEASLRRCAQALTGTAARAAARRVASRIGDKIPSDEMFKIAANAAKHSLEGLRTALDIGSDGEEATCLLRHREGNDLDCEDLTAKHLEEDAVVGIRLLRTVEIAGLAFNMRLDSGWETPAVEDILNPVEIFDSTDPQGEVRSAFTDAFTTWAREIEPKVTIGCKDVTEDAGCLESLSAEIKQISRSVGGGMVSYEDGASLTQKGREFTLSVPLRVKVPILERESQINLTCILDATNWQKPTVKKCGADADLESFVVGILADELGEELKDQTIELGPFSYEVTEVEQETESTDKFRIEGVANLSAIEIAQLKKLDLHIVFDALWKPRVEADLKTFTDSLTGDLKETVNDFVGGAIPLKIEKIAVAEVNHFGIPTAFGIESTADIAGLFSISAPRLVLSSRGFRIDGPNRLAISFPENLTIPVSPFAICPTGGAVEDTELTVTANITLAECTASHLLKYQGRLVIKLDDPGRVVTDGSLTLLGLIPLGNNKGELDLSEPMMSMDAEIGGVAKDIVEMQGTFLISGDPILAKAQSSVALFRVPVGKGHFKLDLTTGQLDMAVRADLGFAKGQGHVGSQRRFSRPSAKFDTQMDIGGFPVFEGDIEARARLAKVGLTVSGMRFGASVPGLDALSVSEILKVLKRFLNLGIDDLERALAGILNGNFQMSPFSDFGGGGDGMGGDGDGKLGESGHEPLGDGDTDGTDEEPNTVGDPPERGTPLAAAGEVEGGPLNQAAVPLWFERHGNADRVRIGVGVRGTPGERLVAVARHDPDHFDPDGLRLGVTMTVHDYGYSQILTREITGSEDCPAGPGGVAYLYRGRDFPRRGYYELCRVSGPDGHLTVEGLEELDAETRVDLAVLNSALVAELADRSSLPTEARVLRKGRLLTSANGNLRGSVALQRPGEFLVAMRGKFSEGESTCGTATKFDVSRDWSGPKIFWITGLGDKAFNDDALILQTVAALWGCPPGALARVDLETGLLTTGSTVSVRRPGAKEFTSIGNLRPLSSREDRVPQWVADLSLDLKKTIERAKRESRRVLEDAALGDALANRSPDAGGASLCIENCGPGRSITMARASPGLCGIWVGDTLSAEVQSEVYGGSHCTLSMDHTSLTTMPGISLTAITHGLSADSTGGLRIGAFVRDPTRSGVTERLAGMATEGLTIDEYHLIRGFLRHAVDSRWPGTMLKATRFTSHPAGSLALIAKQLGSPPMYHWFVRNKAHEHHFVQTGLELSDNQRSAALPIIADMPRLAEAQNSTETGTVLWLRFEQHLRLYTWNEVSESWTMLLELDRPDGPYRDAYEAVVREDILNRLGHGLDRNGLPYYATVFHHVEGMSNWGYALWSSRGNTETLSFKPMPKGKEAWNPTRIGTLKDAGDRIEVAGGNQVAWFDIEVPTKMTGAVLARNLADDKEERDQVLCLFTPSGTPIGCDDDSGVNVEHSNQFAALIAFPSSNEVRRFVAAVRNFNLEEQIGPFQIELMNRPTSLPVADWGICAPPTNNYGCQSLMQQPVRPEEGDFQRVDVDMIGLARTDKAFLRSLAETIDADRKLSGSYSVIASSDAVHAAWQAANGAELRLMSMTEGGTLSSVVAFAADEEATHLPPRHAWPRLVNFFRHSPHAGSPLQGSSLNLPARLGSEAWSTTLPEDAGERIRTIFFMTESGPREVRLASVADSPDVVAPAVSYLLQEEADKVDVRRSEPIVAIVFHQPCQEDDPICPQSLVRLEAGSPEHLAKASFDYRFAPDTGLETALDLFVAETTDNDLSIKLNANWPFEGRWARTHKAGLFRFSSERPFRVVREGGWAGCLSLANLDWVDLESERLLGIWPEEPVKLDNGAVERCTPNSHRHWTLSAGPRSDGHAIDLLHSKDEDGRLQLWTVPSSDSDSLRKVWTTMHPVEPEVATLVVERLPGRISAKDAIVAMTDDVGADSTSRTPMIVFEIAERQIPEDTSASYRTRILAFYRPAGMKRPCMLSGIDVVRPKSAAGELSETHERIVETLRPLLTARDRRACEPVRAREYLLFDVDGGEWQVWERVKGGQPREAFGPKSLHRSHVPGLRQTMVAQAEFQANDAVSASPADEAESRYVEFRQIGEQVLRVGIDDRLYARFAETAADLELEILRAIIRLSGLRDYAPEMPVIELKCIDRSCLLLEGRWRLDVVHGLSLDSGNETTIARAVLLRGSAWREHDRGLASHLSRGVMRGDLFSIFDLRSSLTGDVRLAVRGRGADPRSRPLFHWAPSVPEWRELGNVALRPITDTAEMKHLELPLEQAILDRLMSLPRNFRLISIPDGALLSFDHDRPDELHRSESFLRDGKRGPDILTDEPLDPATDFARLDGSIKAFNRSSPAGERAIWLPGGEASELAVSSPLSRLRNGQVEIHSVHAVEPNDGGDPSRLDFKEDCILPRKVARNLLPGHRHFAGTAKITCSILPSGVVLSDLHRPARQLVGGDGYRAKLDGYTPLADTIAARLADAAYREIGNPFPELSTGALDGYHYASHASAGLGRIWQEKDRELRELGRFYGIDLSDRRHLALLRELGSESGEDLFEGSVKEYRGFVALSVKELNEIIVHGGEAGTTIRIALLERTFPGTDPVNRSIARLLDDNVHKWSLASLGDAAIAFARSKDGSLGKALAYFKGEIVPFKQWPPDLMWDDADGIAPFLLKLLQGDREIGHVFRQEDLLMVCRRAVGGSPRSEFVFFDLSGKRSVGGLEWDKLDCDDTGIPLDQMATVAADRSFRQSVGHLLAYSVNDDTHGVLWGESQVQGQQVFTIEPDGVKSRCKVSLAWDHPARDRLTVWLSGIGKCDWAEQTRSTVVAVAGKHATAIKAAKRWDLEPMRESHRPVLKRNAKRLAAWISDETSLGDAECSALRYGMFEVSSEHLPIFSASVPCFGFALASGSEPLVTRFLRTGDGGKRMSPESMEWLARRFVSATGGEIAYLLDVGDVLKLAPPSPNTSKALLFVWHTSGQTKCAVMFPRKGQTDHRIATVRNSLPYLAPKWSWQGDSLLRATRSTLVNRELAVISRSISQDCVSDFSNPTTRDNSDPSQYRHYALATSGRRDFDWTEVILGEDPDRVLALLDEGEKAAFFAIFQQTGDTPGRSAISIGPSTGLLYSILRDRTLYHRLMGKSPPCKKLDQHKAEELLKKQMQQDVKFNSTQAWEMLFQTVEMRRFGPRWYEEMLTDDPRHALDLISDQC